MGQGLLAASHVLQPLMYHHIHTCCLQGALLQGPCRHSIQAESPQVAGSGQCVCEVRLVLNTGRRRPCAGPALLAPCVLGMHAWRGSVTKPVPQTCCCTVFRSMLVAICIHAWGTSCLWVVSHTYDSH